MNEDVREQQRLAVASGLGSWKLRRTTRLTVQGASQPGPILQYRSEYQARTGGCSHVQSRAQVIKEIHGHVAGHQARVSACSLGLPQREPWPSRTGPTSYRLVGARLWALGGLKWSLSHGQGVRVSRGQTGPVRPMSTLRAQIESSCCLIKAKVEVV